MFLALAGEVSDAVDLGAASETAVCGVDDCSTANATVAHTIPSITIGFFMLRCPFAIKVVEIIAPASAILLARSALC